MKAFGLLAVGVSMCLAGPAQAQSWKLIVTGDSRGSDNGVNTTILGELATAIVNEGAEVVVVPGDLVNAGSQSYFQTWRSTMQPVYDAGIGVYPVRGNHDLGDDAGWNAVFGADIPDNGPTGEVNVTYSVTHRNAFIVGTDQYSGHSHRVDQTWLDQQFAANSQPHVFVFGHEPAFKVSHSDCLDDYPTERNAFWNSILAEGGRSYFAGHDHFYDHARLDDGDADPNNEAHQFIVGTAGAPLYNTGPYNGDNGPWTPQLVFHEKEYGYLLVEINGLEATMTWKHRIGTGRYEATSDVFTYTAIPGPSSALLILLGVGVLTRRRRGG